MSEQHSVHADIIERVLRVLPGGDALTAREDASLDLVDAVQQHLRDGSETATLQIELATREQWDEKEGAHITAWMKRQEFREAGQVIAAIEWITNDPWTGRR